MIAVHSSLNEAIKARFVVRQKGDYRTSNVYWDWCTANAKPFVAVTVRPKSRYVRIELDLYSTSDEGFGSAAGYEILRFVLGQPLKPRSDFFISPILIQLSVIESAVKPVVDFLYQSAIDERILFSQADLTRRMLGRAEKGESIGYGFMPFGMLVHPAVLAEAHDPEFWQRHVLSSHTRQGKQDEAEGAGA